MQFDRIFSEFQMPYEGKNAQASLIVGSDTGERPLRERNIIVIRIYIFVKSEYSEMYLRISENKQTDRLSPVPSVHGSITVTGSPVDHRGPITRE